MITRRRLDPLQVLRATAGPLAVVSIYMVAVVVYEREVEVPLDLPLAIPAMLGTAISILLGFKTSAAYDRWWEARKVWGGIVNDSRSFGRQAISFVRPPQPEDAGAVRTMVEVLVHRQIFWTYALSRSLRREEVLVGTDGLLPPEDVASLASTENVPNEILDLQARDLRRALDAGWLDSYQHVTIEGSLTVSPTTWGAASGSRTRASRPTTATSPRASSGSSPCWSPGPWAETSCGGPSRSASRSS